MISDTKKFAQEMVDCAKRTIDELPAEKKAKAISAAAVIRDTMMQADVAGIAALGLVYWEVALAMENVEEKERNKLN